MKKIVTASPKSTETLTISGFREIEITETCCGNRVLAGNVTGPLVTKATCQSCGARYQLTVSLV